jgi:hypothetical protein
MCKTTELLLLPCVQQAGAGEAAAQGGRRRRPDDPGARLSWGKERGGLGEYKGMLTGAKGDGRRL